MIPVWTKKPANKWNISHFKFYVLVCNRLYAAFAAEVLTRIPENSFLWNWWVCATE